MRTSITTMMKKEYDLVKAFVLNVMSNLFCLENKEADYYEYRNPAEGLHFKKYGSRMCFG